MSQHALHINPSLVAVCPPTRLPLHLQHGFNSTRDSARSRNSAMLGGHGSSRVTLLSPSAICSPLSPDKPSAHAAHHSSIAFVSWNDAVNRCK